jgi:hypothetical protein
MGVSAPRATPHGDAGIDGAAHATSPVAADFREHMTRVSGRQVSGGHGERFDGVVWANDVARAAWDGAGDMPDGAVLVEEAIDRAAKGDRPAGLFVMEKGAGAWRFVAVGAGGEVADDARVAPCAACHREAPRDYVFRAAAPPPAPR